MATAHGLRPRHVPARLALGALTALLGCGDPPVEMGRGEPVPIGDYALTVRRSESVSLTDEEKGLVVFVDLTVTNPRAPGQVHGTGFESLVSDPYHEHREQTLRKGVRVLVLEGNGYRATGYAREDVYRSEMAKGSKAETFWRLAHEDYPNGYWNGESTERWALLFTVPVQLRERVLEIRNHDPRPGQPSEAHVVLAR